MSFLQILTLISLSTLPLLPSFAQAFNCDLALSSSPRLDSFLDYDQKRYQWIYPDVYELALTQDEKIELTHTFDLLEILNNRKTLVSDLQRNFSIAYSVFIKKGRNPSSLHDYFRTLARNDPEQAKTIGDEILSEFDPTKRSFISEMLGIYSSKDPFWTRLDSPGAVKTEFILYSDPRNEDVTGVMVQVNPEMNERRSKLEKFAAAMDKILGVRVASVPPAIEKLKSFGFSTRQAQIVTRERQENIDITGPVIVIPQKDVEFDAILHTTRHEARHAYYNSLRARYYSSPFDGYFAAQSGKTLGTTGGYSVYQSFEELSTHPKDLLEVFRTGNREVLETFKKHSVLLANKLFDIGYFELKASSLNLISEQTVRSSRMAIQELRRKKVALFKDIGFINITHSPEGYRVEFEVKDQFITSVFLSSREERSTVSLFFDDFEAYQKMAVENIEKGTVIEPEVERKGRAALSSLLTVVEQKLGKTLKIAELLHKDSESLRALIETFYKGKIQINREQYLKVRDLIMKPASRVSNQ